MLTMTKIDDIRKAFFEEGISISEISRKQSIDRKTIRKYITKDDFNQPQLKPVIKTEQPKLDPYKGIIDGWLEDDRKAKKKQRHTAQRVFDRLKQEVTGFDCSYRTTAKYVKAKKETMYRTGKSALPLEHKAGEAQVDFGSADFYENGRLYSGKYLNLSFPSSNAGYIQLFKGENMECLLEGLAAIFKRMGGVPHRLWFDNTSTIVTKVLKEGHRDLTDKFLRFKGHYGFTAVFCNPDAGNEKGNVENKVGYHRRNMLVPIPEVKYLETYNRYLLKKSEEDHDREHYRYDRSIAELHKEDLKELLPLPTAEFDCARYEVYSVNLWGKFNIGPVHTYSTSPKQAGGKVTVKITSSKVIPMDENQRVITEHPRLYGNSKQEAMDWLPYLKLLSRCPAALKYTGIYEMLPDPLQEYLAKQPKSECGHVLRVLSWITEHDGFKKAVESVNEAVVRNISGIDSLVTLHDYLNQNHVQERMDIEGRNLPELPPVMFHGELYDNIMQSNGVK